MNILKKNVLNSIQQRSRYFKESREDIANKNALLIMSISAGGIPITILLLLITPLVLPNWYISIGHWFFLPFFLLFFVLGAVAYGKNKWSYAVVHVMVITFAAIFMALIIYINTVPYPESQATLVTAAMIVLPVLFILPFRENVLILFAVLVAFLFMNHRYIIAEVQGKNIFNAIAGLISGILVSWIVTDLRVKENKDKQEIVAQSKQDKLTGILNKSAAERRCFAYLEEDSTDACAMIVMDIDNFKGINDSLGHYAGDKILHMFGDAIRQAFRESDILGRIGGDEFLVLMKNCADYEQVEAKMSKLAEVFRYNVTDKFNLEVTCSYGAILKGDEYIPYMPLFNMADKLLYRAKRKGKNCGEVMTAEKYYQCIGKEKIMLIVDDDITNRTLVRTLFENTFDVIEAGNGLEAMDIIEKYHNIISIMLLEIRMPEVDGFHVLDWMKRQGIMDSFPVIALSSDEHLELKSLELGVVDMVIKPFVPQVLRKRVENAVRK
ncbi:MAG: diguanylate cyclase [Lachnospiraceae bacterium]|nr:diguanylate cyclase [Lachnospiraceae bacterium]